ncbi:MAG: hypothetical protein IGR76_19165, partial [Synechococcales cyanobacterium T60_A2020_003]|nr:hypothetical protein [Synechococcales cyanobacterium T60_A2020_003]
MTVQTCQLEVERKTHRCWIRRIARLVILALVAIGLWGAIAVKPAIQPVWAEDYNKEI